MVKGPKNGLMEHVMRDYGRKIRHVVKENSSMLTEIFVRIN